MDIKKLKKRLTEFLKTVRKNMADPLFMGDHNFEIEDLGENLKIKFHNIRFKKMNAFIINVDTETGKITPVIKLAAPQGFARNYSISFDELCQRMMGVINEYKEN